MAVRVFNSWSSEALPNAALGYAIKVSSGSDKLASLKVGIIPKLIFGIQAFKHKVAADVYLSFEASAEGSIQPKKPFEIKSGEKFDIKKHEICGTVTGLLKADIGAEVALGNIWRPKCSWTIWSHPLNFWKVWLRVLYRMLHSQT